MSRIVLLFTSSLLVALFLFLPGGDADAGKTAGIEMGTAAPDFTLKNLEGEKVCLAQLLEEGPVLLDFWALWCKPCLRALPGTNDIGKEFGEKGLRVITVNTDSPRSLAKVRSYVKSKGFEFEVLLDPNGDMMRLYRFRSIPQIFLIDRDGTITFSKLGYSPGHEKRIIDEIEKLFAAEAEGGQTKEG